MSLSAVPPSSPPDRGPSPPAPVDGDGRVTIIPPAPDPDAEKVMTVVEHLSELRRRLAISVLFVALGTIVGLFLAPLVIGVLVEPLPGEEVVFLSVTGGFAIHLRIALVVGIALGLPVLLYQGWAFVSPGLTVRERRAALPWIPMSVVFFLLGTTVAYLTLPYALAFLYGFQIPGTLVGLPTAEHYFGFVTTLFLTFGVVMQFPILLVLLSRLGILSVARLRTARRYVLLGIVVTAVVLTPGGDPVSPIMMSAVMYLLYEITIWLLGRRGGDAEARG